MDKIFHVFISSTYSDLKDERKKISEAVAKAGFVPEGMEIFPASSQKQMDFIERVIDRCDYYIIIVAGRYGSISEDGISYTEKELLYARSRKIPILAFLKENLEDSPPSKNESDIEILEKRQKLIKSLKKDAIVDFWSNADELSTKALAALSQSHASFEGIGWIRANKAASFDILNEINDLRKENDQLRKNIGQFDLDIPIPELPDHTDRILIDIAANLGSSGYGTPSNYGSQARIECCWIDMFPLFFSNLDWGTSDWNDEYFFHIDEDKSRIRIGSALASFVSGLDTTDAFQLTKNSFDTLHSYFIEAGLMSQQGAEDPFTLGAKKLARRQRITNASCTSKMNVVDGKIAMNSHSKNPDLDDEIPF